MQRAQPRKQAEALVGWAQHAAQTAALDQEVFACPGGVEGAATLCKTRLRLQCAHHAQNAMMDLARTIAFSISPAHIVYANALIKLITNTTCLNERINTVQKHMITVIETVSSVGIHAVVLSLILSDRGIR